MEMTWSSLASLMPRTPTELRPEKTRTLGTRKRMHLPLAVVSNTSSSSVHGCTLIRRESLASSFMAILPLAMTRVKSDRRLRRTVPVEVANMTSVSPQVSSSSGMGMAVVMVSAGCSGSRLTSALPRACGVP